MLHIQVNGQPKVIEEAQTLEAALEHWGYKKQGIAVAVNGTFVSRGQLTTRMIEADDDIEIVAPMQGG